jgi:type I restriction enzyme S subunit
MSEGNGLPKGWAEVTLGELLHRIEGGTSFKCLTRMAGREEWGVIKVSAMTWGTFLEDEQKALPPKTVFDPAAEIKPGDLLISRCNTVELVGASVLVGECRPRLLLSDKSLRLVVAKAIDRKWLQTIMSSHMVRQQMSDVATGSSNSMRNISQDKIKAVRFPLPPLPEQHRIVEKTDELFSDLDAGVSALERAKANLKRYRASVLKSAVEGRLTEEWRKEHPQMEDGQMLLDRILRERREKWEEDQLAQFKKKGKEPAKNWQSKYDEPSAPDTSELPELPEGWVWATVDQVAPPTGGLTKNPNRGSFNRKLPYLRVANVYSNELRLGEMEEIGVEDAELERLLLCKGDLLVVEGNGSKDQIGRVAVWDGSIEPCVHQNHIIKARPAHGMSLWMLSFLVSPNGRNSIEKVASSTSGLYTLSISKVASLPIPLPPLAEQEQIVALVEERLSQIYSAEKTIDAELIRSKRLRQSILKRAFEGKLVPQDPKDEPASILLERIKASKEQEQPKKIKKATKAKAK